jgi:hypothetical protein
MLKRRRTSSASTCGGRPRPGPARRGARCRPLPALRPGPKRTISCHYLCLPCRRLRLSPPRSAAPAGDSPARPARAPALALARAYESAAADSDRHHTRRTGDSMYVLALCQDQLTGSRDTPAGPSRSRSSSSGYYRDYSGYRHGDPAAAGQRPRRRARFESAT